MTNQPTTLAHAMFWIDMQRQKLGNPNITRVEAALCEDSRWCMVYCDVADQHITTGDLPVAASFDLGRTVTLAEFDEMRDAVEHRFECLNKMTKH
jgi:hypothetical protein